MRPDDLALKDHLERLYRGADLARYRARDPVAFVHRYHNPADQEVVAFFASGLAFGRVDLFRPVLDALCARFDARGGPAAWVRALDRAEAGVIEPMYYRWCRGADLAVLGGALQRALQRGPLQNLLGGVGPLEDRARAALHTLRADAVRATAMLGRPVLNPNSLPRGVKFLLPDPDASSGLKRWNLLLRWLVRPADDGVDLGLWTSVTPSELILPLDTHTGRIARLIGLTTRRDTSWKTAVDITTTLRRLDPVDPIRFDFALAHAGISDRCHGRFDVETCPGCALRPICSAGQPAW